MPWMAQSSPRATSASSSSPPSHTSAVSPSTPATSPPAGPRPCSRSSLHAKPLKHIDLSPTIDRPRGWSFLPPGVMEFRERELQTRLRTMESLLVLENLVLASEGLAVGVAVEVVPTSSSPQVKRDKQLQPPNNNITTTIMTAGATSSSRQSHLQTFPNELIENIVEFIEDWGLDSLRSLRLVCRNVHPVATKFYAEQRFAKICLSATKSKVDAATDIFANPTLRQTVKHVELHFPGYHTLVSYLNALEDDVKHFRTEKETRSTGQPHRTALEVSEEAFNEWQAGFQATYDTDCEEVDLSQLLALFPNLGRLEFKKLNRANLSSKLPWLSLAAAITPAGTKLETLVFEDCEITADDIRHVLSIFDATTTLHIDGKYTIINDWASVICSILVHGKSLKCLHISKSLGPMVRLLSKDIDEETCREFQKLFRTFESYRITPRSVEASGELAVKYACEKVVRNLVGNEAFEDMLSKCKNGIEI
ncbi:hypothetical protein M409DRAFT_54701 [Zasmidium cellare ATCC 36951]|uniref:F-box domain-containing protein n=1 Tax=Zasmidium cellare ATCC 36951 TaxID=1080233 RepID=A0A6A6CMG8_ZASCE|nr:uncharacterized protein M409DRAFT_54701 [Zasmidium cellare ATCC 36951]KAF2166939.1 hypothetical protein M409DRAFT_54701 [Zasmidium cellare ATCC 36951]